MPRRSSRVSASQPSTSKSANKSQRLERTQSTSSNGDLTQTRINQHFNLTQTNVNDLVNNCVRYFVNNAGQNVYFRRAEIQKQVLSKAGSQFQQILDKATNILKTVYGYNLLVCDPTQNSSKAFVVSNAMPYMDYHLNEEETDIKDVRKILLLLILTHIYMSNFPISEASLYTFLSNLGIETNKRHPLFGQVKDYIMNTLVKQKYLAAETDAITKKVTFSWGIRSEREISKHELLKFICKIYKDRQPKNWTNQYQVANEQRFENDRLAQVNSMEIDEE